MISRSDISEKMKESMVRRYVQHSGLQFSSEEKAVRIIMKPASPISNERVSQLAQQASQLAERLCELSTDEFLKGEQLEEYLLIRERIETLVRAMNTDQDSQSYSTDARY